ncbi:hypothetical protein CARUB_v10023956mg [Capsella rubella]|uniref:Uncharacterized protein n=1 Tax=Capsella rubella TaxID=81985 RepID=R0HUN7_9BRAS|nr:protein HEAT-INDUCED TAS1 TARGET 4 [Capsella rubella]EOA27803.1 hypothetical protein CARUB_v10023956mg [Capsella rubella]
MALATSCHPDCKRATDAQEDYDASHSAAMVAANLISSARLILNLDTEYTQYSAQFLVDNARSKREDGQRCDLTVKDALAFALKKGIPKEVLWAHLGCIFKPPPSACHIPRVHMKGKVVEAKDLDGAFKLLEHQPVGAKLHVFTPDIDLLGDGIFHGPSGYESSYVGLRDVVIVSVKNIEDETVATVKICYKKKTAYIKVSLTQMFMSVPHNGDSSQDIGPTGLLVDFCVPRLSINRKRA